MIAVIRNPLIVVWALLTTVTLVSWSVARDGGASHRLNTWVTVIVLLIAAFKTALVIGYFMEVRRAPGWLKATTGAWLVTLFALLLGCYLASA